MEIHQSNKPSAASDDGYSSPEQPNQMINPEQNWVDFAATEQFIAVITASMLQLMFWKTGHLLQDFWTFVN